MRRAAESLLAADDAADALTRLSRWSAFATEATASGNTATFEATRQMPATDGITHQSRADAPREERNRVWPGSCSE